MGLSRDHSTLKLEVKDNGQGIEAELLPYIFDRFRQADSSTRRKFGGLGLGLSIVKHLIESHGGTIEAESGGQNLGTTFTIRLPTRAMKQSPTPIKTKSEDYESLSEDPLAPQPLSLDGLRVLVVDDNRDARQMLLTALESVGAVVTVAANVDSAINLLEGTVQKFDALVSDLGMPDQDGFDLIRAVRRLNAPLSELPAVALSGFAHSDDARDAVAAGFQAHLSKPVDLYELTVTIKNLIG